MVQCNEPSQSVLDSLKAIVGAGGWLDSVAAEPYLREPRDRIAGRAALVVRPATTQEVAAVVECCAAGRVGIVPRAGGTGLVQGQVTDASPSPIVLSVDRMRAVRDVAVADGAMTVEAGCTLADARATAAEHGQRFPLRIASEGECRIGGNLATNAGGMNVLRYGNARELCLGVEAVLADGQVWDGLSSLRKNNTGYDLRDLMIGSEGTLGIITAATLRLFPAPDETVTAWVAPTDLESAVELAARLRTEIGETLSVAELMEYTGLRFVAKHFPELRNPLAEEHDWHMLVEAESGAGGNVRARLEAVLSVALEAGLVKDAVLAENEAQRQSMYNLRESIPLANRREGAVATHDIAVPLSRVATMVAAVRHVVERHDSTLCTNIFGHLGDGNLHANVFAPAGQAADNFAHLRSNVTSDIFAAVRELDGSISAEHGVGRTRKAAAMEGRGQAVRWAAMAAIKRALDPHGILNPGAVVDGAVAN